MTTASSALPAGRVTVAVSGLTTGPPTAGSSSGVNVATSQDSGSSVGADSGGLGGRVSSVSFTMAAADRVANAAGKSATFAFTTASAVPAGGKLTLFFSRDFFSIDSLPIALICVASVSYTDYIYTISNGDNNVLSAAVVTAASTVLPAGRVTVTCGTEMTS